MHGGEEFKVNVPGQGNVLVKVPVGQSAGAKLLFNVPKAREGLVALASSDSSTHSEQETMEAGKEDQEASQSKLLSKPRVSVRTEANGEEKVTIVLPAAAAAEQTSAADADAAIKRLDAKMKQLEAEVIAEKQAAKKELKSKTVYEVVL